MSSGVIILGFKITWFFPIELSLDDAAFWMAEATAMFYSIILLSWVEDEGVYSNFAGIPMVGGVVVPSKGLFGLSICALSLSFISSDVSFSRATVSCLAYSFSTYCAANDDC